MARLKTLRLISTVKMKSLLLVAAMILSGITVSLHAGTTDLALKDNPNLERLSRIATNEGEVHVIIGLRIAGLDQLLSESRGHGSLLPGSGRAWDGMDADTQLAAAIRRQADEVLHQLNGKGYKLNHIYRSIPYMALSVSKEALDTLIRSESILSIEEDVAIPLPPAPSGSGAKDGSAPAADSPAPPLLADSTLLTGAENAWAMGYTGSGWYVAILDTGIRSTHEFFNGKTIVESCFAKGEDGAAGAGDCPNGLSTASGPGTAVHYPSTYSGYDHGTHVAGISAGHATGRDGMAPDADIIAVQVFSRFADCSSAEGAQPCVMSWNSDQLAGLDYVYSIRGSYSIAAVNMSLGGGQYTSACDSDSRKAAIDNLRSVGIATAIATGNDGYCSYIGAPGCISSSVAVGASTDADAEAYFNNWHPTMLKLFAPGYGIISSVGSTDTAYAAKSGTSMATPHVTGAWALLKQAKPDIGVADALAALQATGTGITSVCDGYATPLPRIQVDQAITAITRSLTVTAPNGAESWPAGDTRAITWDSSGITDPLTIALLKDGTKIGVIANNVNPADAAYNWTVGEFIGGTAAAADGYTIKIKVNGIACTDFSDAPFSITSSGITVTSPAAGITWSSEMVREITWTASGVSGLLTISLLKDGVKVGVIAQNVAPADGGYEWIVGTFIGGSAAPASGYSIKIKEQGVAVTGWSPGTFSISADPVINVTSPAGGEAWVLNSEGPITWECSGISNPVTISLLKDGVKIGVIARDIPAGSHLHPWLVGQYIGGVATPGPGYTIKIKEQGVAVTGWSPAPFTIQDDRR